MAIVQVNKLPKCWSQIAGIFIVAISMTNDGLLLGWSSSAISDLNSGRYGYKMSYDETSWFTILPPIATIIASIPVGILVNRFGRKKVLLMGAIPYFIAWVLIGIGGSSTIFYASRFIVGVGSACSICASSLYIAEFTQPKVRGSWGNMVSITLVLGILLAYILGAYLTMATIAYICMVVPVVQFILICGIPESPYFLFIQKRYDEAKISLQWFRQTDDVNTEFIEIGTAVERQMTEAGSYKDVFLIRSNRKALIIVVVLRLTQQFSGMSAFIVYAQTIFDRAGGNISSSTSAIICGSIQLMFAIVGSMVVARFGRRMAMLSSAISCVIILSLMAIYFYLETETDSNLSAWMWFPLVGMIIYLIVFGLGLAVVPTLMSGELFSSSVKEKSMAINNMVLALLIASTTKLFQVLAEYELWVPFAYQAITCALLTLVSFVIVPETKGKTLDEIQLEFFNKPKVEIL